MSTENQPPIAGAPKQSALIAFDGGGLVLNTMEQAFIFAKAVVNSGLAPRDFKTPEAVLIAVQMGAEIGLAPMTSLQNIAVINGKPGIYGDAGKALLRSRGFDIEEQCDGTRAVCTISHPRQKAVTRAFTVADAEKAGLWKKAGPWTQYPSRMLAWRAFWWAARDAGADILKGIGGVEELRDTPTEPKNVTPPAPAQRLAALDAPAQPDVPAEPVSPAADPLEHGDEQTRMDLEASRT